MREFDTDILLNFKIKLNLIRNIKVNYVENKDNLSIYA